MYFCYSMLFNQFIPEVSIDDEIDCSVYKFGVSPTDLFLYIIVNFNSLFGFVNGCVVTHNEVTTPK